MYLHFYIGEKICFSRQIDQPNLVRIEATAMENESLAQLSGNQIKLLLTLLFRASFLTCGQFFEKLKQQSLADSQDLGRVICYRSQSDLAGDCGLNSQTVGANLHALEKLGYITRRMKRIGGRFTKPLFLIHAELCTSNHCGKAVSENPYHDGVAAVVDPTDPEDSSNDEQQQTTQHAVEFCAPVRDLVFDAFAEALGEPYTPQPSDLRVLIDLLDLGYSPAHIATVIREPVERAVANGKTPRHFGYCRPIVLNTSPVTADHNDSTETQSHTEQVSDVSSAPGSSPPSLPDHIIEALRNLSWADTYDEIAAFYDDDPDRVEDWLAYCVALEDPSVNSPAGLFISMLRKGLPAPPKKRSREQEAKIAIEKAWERRKQQQRARRSV